jgi:hypothetical protein
MYGTVYIYIYIHIYDLSELARFADRARVVVQCYLPQDLVGGTSVLLHPPLRCARCNVRERSERGRSVRGRSVRGRECDCTVSALYCIGTVLYCIGTVL